jgi:hypothetical protein
MCINTLQIRKKIRNYWAYLFCLDILEAYERIAKCWYNTSFRVIWTKNNKLIVSENKKHEIPYYC